MTRSTRRRSTPTLARAATLVAVVAMATRGARAQGDGGSRAGLLLTLPTSTRALGLGAASAAAGADEWATFFSPAQLAALRAPAMGAATEAYLAGTQLTAVAFALPVGRGTLGIGATLLDYGAIDEIASPLPGGDGTETGHTYTAQDNAFVVAYGRETRGAVRLGVAAEYFGTHVADLSGSGFAASGSAAWTSRRGWDVSAAVQHAGPDVTLGATRGSLPVTARFTVAAPARHRGAFTVRPMLEVRSVRGAGTFGAAAAEATWQAGTGTAVTGRAGYTLAPGSDDHAPVSLGLGVALGSFTLDYAFERFRTIGQVTHRVGLRYAWRPAR
ncbi:MAG TPA: hypothetical protein VG916_01820 [Gemmatimonadaceae bacterium]|nr:hypothetical protein [Gemmatimonadaceae bacterium]